MNLHRFHGGLKLAAHKQAAASPIAACAPPAQLVVPLSQQAGMAARCLVAVGRRVRRGEAIGRAAGDHATSVHAPCSGIVVAIEPRSVAGPAETSLCVVIDNDGRDETVLLEPIEDWRGAPRDVLLERIAAAGIVGLGGAAFPTAVKLDARVDTLIANGAECEPYIACDEALLRSRAADVVAGARLLRHACGARRTLIAVEERMGEARLALSAALAEASSGDDAIELVGVPTIYPAGGERQLIRVLTGREVPSGGLPRDIGVVVVNVATVAACWRAVAVGEVLTERIVTVSGRGVRRPCNLLARIGTPIAHLVEAAGGYTDAAARLVMGGPMMGMALPHDDIPVVKASNCVLVLGADDVRERAPELPCIRCGECSQACPAQLLPQQLLMQLKSNEFDAAREHGLFDCIECGLCAFVCPSQIPLVDWYRHGKSELRSRADGRTRADHARERFHARNARLARDAAERVARVQARKDAPARETGGERREAEKPPAAAMDKAAVLAAIARGKAKKRAGGDSSSTDDTTATSSPPHPPLEGEE